MIRLEYDFNDLDKPLNKLFCKVPEKANYMLNLKAIIGSLFSNLERLFKGCFAQGLNLDCNEQQYDVFKRVFPVIGRILERMEGPRSMAVLCDMLRVIRNECLHARSHFPSKTIIVDPRFIEALPNYGQHFYADEKGRLTLAGLFAILMCMANKEMISSMAASGIVMLVKQIGLFKGFETLNNWDYSARLEDELGTDLEATIRTQKGDDPMTALWGEYMPKVKTREGSFVYLDSDNYSSSFQRVRGSFKDKEGKLILRIHKGSYYHVYFPEKYELWIEDVSYFVELANKVPPFMLVPFLYRLGIERLYRGVLTEKQEELCGKLNKAKFYVDKNVNILVLGDTVSDQRMMSQSAMPQILYCLLNLEWNLYWRHAKVIQGEKTYYSTLAEGLKAIGISEQLAEDVVKLRNFAAHGYIFGDFYGWSLSFYTKIDLNYAARVLRELAEAMSEVDEFIADRLREDVAWRLVAQLSDVKYKAYAQRWDDIIRMHLVLGERLVKPMGRINASYLTSELEKVFGSFIRSKFDCRYTVYDVEISPRFVLALNNQPVGMSEIKIVQLKKDIDLGAIFGPIEQGKIVEIESSTNPLIRYKRLKIIE